MKDGFIKVAAASPAVKIADFEGNSSEIIRIVKNADGLGVKILTFPELCLTAYTCGDLFFSSVLIDGAKNALSRIIKETKDSDVLFAVGLPLEWKGRLYNCAAIIKDGKLLGIVPKANIPNYGEHKEGRYFAPAPEENSYFNFFGEMVPFGKNLIFSCNEIDELKISSEICEDMYSGMPPAVHHCAAGTTVVLNLSASSELAAKAEYRRILLKSQSARSVCAYIYSNAGDGESTTDMVFSGHSMIAEAGEIIAEREPFENGKELLVTEIDVKMLASERRRINRTESCDIGEYDFVSFSLQKTDTVLTRYVSPYPFIPTDPSERARRLELILMIQAKGLAGRIEAACAKKCVVAISGGLDSTLALLATVKAMDILGRSRKDIVTVTMPCFGTTKRTKNNAEMLCTELDTDFRCVDIAESVNLHFKDIGHDSEKFDVVYENAQARQRTLVVMDIANKEGGIVIGTGDLSELVLGWATYNGDHMSMYGVNSSIPKTLVRQLVEYCAYIYKNEEKHSLSSLLGDILDTPVSPELLPVKNGEMSQITEDIVGPYELHDFHLYYMLRYGFSPRKLVRLSERAFGEKYDRDVRLKWLEILIKRFFTQQFKRSCLPDGPKVGTIGVSPRGDLSMPSDAKNSMWLKEIENIKSE